MDLHIGDNAVDNQTPGQIACEAWTASHKRRHQCNIAGWDSLREPDRLDWEAVAVAVLEAVSKAN